MNEKIKQFAEQAGLLGPGSRVGNAHEATEKFAELIVRECVAEADKCAERGSWMAGYRIKQHFGVKE